jgi:hypothetical protein
MKYQSHWYESDLEICALVTQTECTKYLRVRIADLYFSVLHMASLSFQEEYPEVFPNVWFMLACEVDHSSDLLRLGAVVDAPALRHKL